MSIRAKERVTIKREHTSGQQRERACVIDEEMN